MLTDSWRGDHGGIDATFPCKCDSRPEQKSERVALSLGGCEKSGVDACEIALGRWHTQSHRGEIGCPQSIRG